MKPQNPAINFLKRKETAGGLLSYLSGGAAVPALLNALSPGNLRQSALKREEQVLEAQRQAEEAAFQEEQRLQSAFQEAVMAKRAPAVSGKEAAIAGGISLLGGLLGARPQYTQGAFNQFMGNRQQAADEEQQKQMLAAKMALETGMQGVDHRRKMSGFDMAREKMMAGRAAGAADQMDAISAARQKQEMDMAAAQAKAQGEAFDRQLKAAGTAADLVGMLDTATDRGQVHAIAQILQQVGSPLQPNVINAAAKAADERGALPGRKFDFESGLAVQKLGIEQEKLRIDWAKYGLDVAKTNQQMDISQRNLAMAEQKHAERVLTQPERQAAVDGVSMTLKPLLDAFNKAKMDPEGDAATIQTELLKTLRRGAALLGANHPAIAKYTSALKAAGVSPDALATLESTNPYEYATRPFERALKGAASAAPEGTPYVWGGQSLSKGIDCSGLVCEVYNNAGIDLGDNTAAGYFGDKRFKPTTREALRPGDLIFYHSDKKNPGKVSHVGIYMGDGKVKHASSSKGTVTVPMTSLKYPVAGYRTYKNG